MAEINVQDTLIGLKSSLEAATSVLPSADSICPPENGISLLDVKNELFLSYLQSLALRNLEVIRSVQKYVPGKGLSTEDAYHEQNVQDQIVEGLVKQRLYLEKGVRPLEDRLKYTIDKTLRVAEEQDRKAQQTPVGQTAEGPAKKGQEVSDSDSDESDSESDSSIDENAALSLGPNAAAMMSQVSREDTTRQQPRGEENKGVYRPPRITATAMPERIPRAEARKERARPDRSRTLDDYVASELADAPTAQPSIGANIAEGGRRQISERERAKEQERRDYEEANFTRLQESKKDKAKRKGRGGFGGEEWRDLGEGIDRINSLTRGTKRKDKEGALEKSRKRRATEDGQRGDGMGGTGLFEKRKKRMMARMK